ncbi:hypothetical protein P43SY_004666 [Pythium insidiosum]|uniref:RZ-type domain-containing protein n=1 Tax=Pythium insidiosum TaxID=114742 RepID=A0AAD5M0K3_PYTIN|nr:hypothetical protein P43SY_004666 [Pythium insidiosum]
MLLKATRGTGHWYSCSRGHLYLVGGCGTPDEFGRCPTCGEPIGGTRTALAAGNRRVSLLDERCARV